MKCLSGLRPHVCSGFSLVGINYTTYNALKQTVATVPQFTCFSLFCTNVVDLLSPRLPSKIIIQIIIECYTNKDEKVF